MKEAFPFYKCVDRGVQFVYKSRLTVLARSWSRAVFLGQIHLPPEQIHYGLMDDSSINFVRLKNHQKCKNLAKNEEKNLSRN